MHFWRRTVLGVAVVMAMMIPVQTAAVAAPVEFDRFFTGSTMRVDYYHSGTKTTESFSLDRVLAEGPWSGSRTNLVDSLNLGEYMVRVFDRATTTLIYSRGFSSIFNEWQTTDEATAGLSRTFHESALIPSPRRAVQLVIARRDRRMDFHEVFSVVLDPADPTVVRKEQRSPAFPVQDILINGPAASRVDIVILGDGYGRGDQEKLRRDARRFTDALFSTHPFSKRKGDFNVRLVQVVSDESGIDVPDKDVWKKNALGCMYNTFGSARYVLTTDNASVRDVAAAAPYDFICILVNDTRYGGGGIYQLYTTTYTGEQVKGQEWQMDYVFVHEFGHSFGGLGDEYYGSSVAYTDFYPPGVEPWEPNVTAQTDRTKLKWAGMVRPGTPVPTPWQKAAYDSLGALRAKLDRLAPDYYQKREPYYKAEMETLRDPGLSGVVGAFEGSGYASRGLYRPALDCRMFSLATVDFDPVCSAALERVIDFYAR